MANVQVSEAEKEDNPLPLLDISSEEESKKTGDVVAVAASIMEPQKSEQPDILKQLLGSFDWVCGAPKFQEIINKEDPSKESSAADFPIVTEPAPLSNESSAAELSVLEELMRNPSLCSTVKQLSELAPLSNESSAAELSVLEELMRNPSLCSIVTTINDGYDTLTMTVNEAIFPVPTESAQSAKKALDKKEVTKNKKTISGLLRKFVKRS